jgi:hypothetical protein
MVLHEAARNASTQRKAEAIFVFIIQSDFLAVSTTVSCQARVKKL